MVRLSQDKHTPDPITIDIDKMINYNKTKIYPLGVYGKKFNY